MTESNTSQTNTLLTKPKHIISLATSSVLVHTDVRVWTATMQDSEISHEVTTAKKADRDSGKFVKHLLANCAEHKKCMNYRQIVYNWTQRRTYPWAGSMRILPVVDMPKYMKEYQQHEDTFNQLVDDFIKVYPTIISNRAFTMGDLFNPDDYPTAEQVRHKFSINLYRAEVPTGDFRCDIANDLTNDLAVHYERQARELITSILGRQQEQLIEIMQTIKANCATETVTENGEIKIKRKKLYESTLTRAQELISTFRDFNLTEDTRLEEARADFAKLLDGVTIETLRDSDTMRVVMQEGIDDILKKFGM
jgi:hypothetical protein